MVDSPIPTIMYTILYLIIVYVGPRLMKSRKPYKLTWALIPYNLAMALLNLYIAVEVSCKILNSFSLINIIIGNNSHIFVFNFSY